jgi:hypothetical protein
LGTQCCYSSSCLTCKEEGWIDVHVQMHDNNLNECEPNRQQ